MAYQLSAYMSLEPLMKLVLTTSLNPVYSYFLHTNKIINRRSTISQCDVMRACRSAIFANCFPTGCKLCNVLHLHTRKLVLTCHWCNYQWQVVFGWPELFPRKNTSFLKD
jgi:hypothetical protein